MRFNLIDKLKSFTDSEQYEDIYYNGEEVGGESLWFNKLLRNTKLFTIVYWVLAGIGFILLLYLFNDLQGTSISDLLKTGEVKINKPSVFHTLISLKWVFFIYLVLAAVLYGKLLYKIKMAFRDIGQGLEGNSRWASRKEVDAAYRKIPDREVEYEGSGGMPVARDGNFLYIDDTSVNNLIIGTSRSGKGEEHVLPCIEIYSRAKHKPSLIVTDIKMELAPATMKLLQKRGYETWLLNLVDPEYSMFFNPLTFIIDEYVNGRREKAHDLVNTLAYSIIPRNPEEKDPFWSDQARELLKAAIIADIEDSLQADKLINERAKRHFVESQKEEKEEAINSLPYEEKILFKVLEEVEEIRNRDPEISTEALMEEIKKGYVAGDIRRAVMGKSISEFEEYIEREKPEIDYEPTITFTPTTENIDKCNLNSIVRRVSILSGINISQQVTALDRYFMSRPSDDDQAKVLYSGIASAAPNTKGTIMSTFSTKIMVFKSDSIGRITAMNSLNFMDVGWGKKPVAVFIALPASDKSNWFIATSFIDQLYVTITKFAQATPGNRTYRDVVFLLDEFGNLPPFDNVDNMVSAALGMGCRFHFIIQDFAQLDKAYGQEIAKTIKGNCGNWKYLLTTDDETAQKIETILGYRTVVKVNRSGKAGSLKKEYTEMAEKVPLKSANDLMQKMLFGETIIIRPLHRKDNFGNDQYAHPIRNVGKYRMKLRFEYLGDLVSTGNILYRSENLDRLLQNNEDLYNVYDSPENPLEKRIIDVNLNRTDGFDMASKRMSPTAWFEHYQYVNMTVSEYAEKGEANRLRMERVLDLTDYSPEEKEAIFNGEEGEYQLTIADLINYAHKLISIPKHQKIGYKFLDLLEPIDYSKYVKEENVNPFEDLEYNYGEIEE